MKDAKEVNWAELREFTEVGISLANYVFQRRRYEWRAEFVRKQCAEQLKKHLEKKEAENGGTNNDN